MIRSKHGITRDDPRYTVMYYHAKRYGITIKELIDDPDKYPIIDRRACKPKTPVKQLPSRNYEARRSQHLKHTFGLTVEDYNNMLKNQGGKCAICGKHQSDMSRPFHVDHCHNTGKIRGLLCNTCNTGIGGLQDNPIIVMNAYKYLTNVQPIQGEEKETECTQGI